MIIPIAIDTTPTIGAILSGLVSLILAVEAEVDHPIATAK